MELEELDSYIETYNKEIEPRIKSGNYEDPDLKVFLKGLVAVLLEENLRNNIAMKLDRYSLQSSADAQILLENIENGERDPQRINRLNDNLKISLRQYNMGLKAQS